MTTTSPTYADPADTVVNCDKYFQVSIPSLYADIVEDYVVFLGANPRRLARLINSYRMHMNLLYLTTSRDPAKRLVTRAMAHKLVQWTILCDLWPIRVSFLLAASRYKATADALSKLSIARAFSKVNVCCKSKNDKPIKLEDLIAMKPTLNDAAEKVEGDKKLSGLSSALYALEHESKRFGELLAHGKEEDCEGGDILQFVDVLGLGDGLIGLKKLTTNLNPAATEFIAALVRAHVITFDGDVPFLEDAGEFSSSEAGVSADRSVDEDTATICSLSEEEQSYDNVLESVGRGQERSADGGADRLVLEDEDATGAAEMELTMPAELPVVPEASEPEPSAVHRQMKTELPTNTDDKPDGVDRLEFDVYIRALVSAIISDRPPKRTGLYAPWGTGKSFLINKLEKFLYCRTLTHDNGEPEYFVRKLEYLY